MVSLEGWVQSHINHLRAPLKSRTMFGPAGRAVIRSKGERVIFGPDGQPVHVIELPEGGTQIEHDDEDGNYHLHANIRPQTIRLRLDVN